MKHLLTLAALSFSISFATAQPGQEKYPPRVFLNGNLQAGIPMDDFREKLNDTGIGFGFQGLAQLGNRPVYAGLDFGWMRYEGENQEFTIEVGGLFEDYEWKTRSNILTGHGVIRFQPDMPVAIYPYVDGMFGFKTLYTRTRLIDLNGEENEVIERSTNQRDWAYSYGGAIGIQLGLFPNPGITLDLRLMYLLGESASYLTRIPGTAGQIFEEPIDAFELKSSPTTLLIPTIGVTIELFVVENWTPEGDFE